MKNTVNLDKFVELKEKDLQNIKGGEIRKTSNSLLNFFKRR